jgi:catechol 2,3-dioxygenase-like lactoylglutathione lyase family enzyme
MSSGLSHVIFLISDLDRMQIILEQVLHARCIYRSGARHFSVAPERFFLVGQTWVATMLGDPLAQRSYNHVAFQVLESDLDARRAAITSLGLDIRAGRPRVSGEGQSIYFYTPDNHLIELHAGTLEQRLARYAETERGEE